MISFVFTCFNNTQKSPPFQLTAPTHGQKTSFFSREDEPERLWTGEHEAKQRIEFTRSLSGTSRTSGRGRPSQAKVLQDTSVRTSQRNSRASTQGSPPSRQALPPLRGTSNQLLSASPHKDKRQRMTKQKKKEKTRANKQDLAETEAKDRGNREN